MRSFTAFRASDRRLGHNAEQPQILRYAQDDRQEEGCATRADDRLTGSFEFRQLWRDYDTPQASALRN